VVASLQKRVRLIAVVVLLSLLIAALPVSSSRTRATAAGSTAGSVQESLPLQFYRSVRTTFAAIGTWMSESLRSKSAAPVSTYEPVTAYISPAPPFIDAPTNLTMTAASDTSLSLSWTPPGGAVAHYQIERSQSVSGPFLFRANTASTTFQDTSVTTDQAYLYRVRAVTSGGVPSAPSNMALGTTTSFEFNGAALVGNVVKKQHIYDIRTAINAVRAVAGLTAATWTRSDLTNLLIVVNDVQELRTKLGEALTVLSISPGAYTDPTLTAGVTIIKGVHVDQLQVRSTRGSSSSSGPMDSDSSTARLDPLNETGGRGENPLSRNFNWTFPLLSLRGRAGMDLGLSLSYNSLVWTKVGNTVSFNDDNGFPAPGFRLGFPVIESQPYFNTETQKEAFLLIGSDGSRTELRRVSTSGAGANLYEAADSSHLLLDTSLTPKILRTANGTQLSYELKGGDLKCTKIKDRNGNYITVNYTTAGHIDEVIDTLGRSIDFVYDGNGRLTQIKQLWNAGSVTQYWARFTYANTTIDTNFPGLTIFGPADGNQLEMLSRVTLADDSYFQFSPTSWGQVWKITKFGSDNQPINYRSYNLPQTGATAHTDCPRFTARNDWAKYWNGDTDGTTATNEETLTAFIVPVSDTWTMPGPGGQLTGIRAQVTAPDGTINKFYFTGAAGSQTGWSRGLPVLIDTVSAGAPQRRVATTWTQDNTTVSYQLNPRVLETNVYDAAQNRARTRTEYQQFTFANTTNCWLPRDVFEYDVNASTVIRTTRTNYSTNAAYSDRRILGLPTETLLYQGDVNGSNPPLMSRSEFVYDEAGAFVATEVPTVQHDGANYSGHFVGRANLTKVIRHNVSITESTSTSGKYNRAGAVVSTKDASDHEVLISHADAFSDNVPRGTFAYPTTVTDPGGFSATSKYNFDFGAPTYQRTPQANGASNNGPEQTFTYDTIGRLLQTTSLVNNSYTRFEYSTASQLRVDRYRTIQSGLGEARSFEITDGAGRVIATATQHLGSAGGYSGERVVYDIMGRAIKKSNPTETSASGTPFQWNTTGDDLSAGWIFTEQTYDWNGRPLVTTYPSVTGNPADTTTKSVSYSSCGCAAEVVTLTDEGTIDPADHVTPRKRQQKTHKDILGRIVKTEILNWENGTPYATTVNTYNVRDQETLVRRFAGAGPADPSDLTCTSGNCQKTDLTYDGYGRLKTKHTPAQQFDANNPASTDHVTWDYNSDDTIQKITDPRGTVSNFTYNSRHLVTGVSFTMLPNVPTTGISGVASTPSVSYGYDAAGNRTSMTDGMGTVNYNYDQLSRLLTETRYFSNLSGSSTGGNYTLTYGYNLGNQLTSVTDPFNAQVNYNFDATGRLSSVTGTGFTVSTFLSNIQYRAWGAPKSVTLGDNRVANTTYDARLRISSYELTIVPQDNLKLRNQYEYYADGKLKKMTDLDDHEPSIIGDPNTARHFSRIYDFDHAGRLTRAKGIKPTGVEEDRPFTQSYSYDAFSNLTNRSGRYYYQPITSDPNTFLNNRRTSASYGADGQETQSTAPGTTRDWSYDAAGNLVKVKETVTATSAVSTFVTTYDGDGKPVREFLQENQASTDAYMVRSTVFNGEVVTRLNNVGNKTGTIVEIDDRITPTRISTGNTGGVAWIHIDPLGLSIAGDAKPVFDPMGNRIAWQPVPLGPPPGTYPRTSASSGLGSLFGSGQDRNCVLNDLPISCQELDRQIWLGVVNIVGRRGIHPAEQPFGVVRRWVEDDGPKKGNQDDTRKGAEVEEGDVITTTTEEDGKGHYEYFLVPELMNISPPQNSTQDNRTDCQRFADMVAEIASRHDTSEGFMNEMARTFTAANDSTKEEMSRNIENALPPDRIQIGDGGFRSQYRDGTNLQVRHFVGGLLYGYRYGYERPMAAALISELTTPAPAGSMADVRLNDWSMAWGASAEPRPATVTGHMGVMIKKPAHPGYRGIADAIRRHICE
jgi:YD repeat-containing protein